MASMIQGLAHEAKPRTLESPSIPALCILVALWLACQGTHFRDMASIWFEGGDMAHGPLVPLVVGYIVWSRRGVLRQIVPRPSRWGLVLVICSALEAIFSLAADWRVFGFLTFWISLVGGIWYLYGIPMLRALAYPIALLLLMMPPPTFLYEKTTLSLQILSSVLAENGLERLGYSVLREGNILEMLGERLSVAEACSGMRALIAIVFFCAVYNFFFVTSFVLRAVLWLAALPIAVLGNTARIVVTGVLGQYNRNLVHGTFHELLGYLSLTLAGCGFIALHQICAIFYRRSGTHNTDA